jgi:hypothetical protein
MKTTKTQSSIETLYKKMGLVEVTNSKQRKNGTRVFFDSIANCNFIFRQFSSPRVEYFSNTTRSIQSYRMFEPTGMTITEDMNEAIPYIVNRKVKGVQERAQSAFRIASSLI